jgi:hypothetical protein
MMEMEKYRVPAFDSVGIIKSLDQWQSDLSVTFYSVDDDSYPDNIILNISDQGIRHLRLDGIILDETWHLW